VFAAVTSRMLSPKTDQPTDGGLRLWLRGSLFRGTAWPRLRPGTVKTRTKEVGFQLLCGSARPFIRRLRRGPTGACGLASFAPQACCEVYTAWAEKDSGLAAEKQERIAKAGIEIAGRWILV